MKITTGAKYVLSAVLLTLLSACGGGGSTTSSNSNGATNPPPQPATPSQSGRFVLLDPTRSNATTGIAGLTFLDNGSTTSADGSFTAPSPNLQITLGSNTRLALTGKTQLTQHDLAAALCNGNADAAACNYNVRKNLEQFFLSVDSDRNSSNGIQLASFANSLNLAWVIAPDQFEVALASQLAPYGYSAVRTFTPTLGINTEATQSEQNDIVLPMPFVDVFRTARPFAEYSCKDVTYDQNGWANALPASCSGKNPAVIRTFLLDNVTKGMLPEGNYSVFYEGNGTLEYSGYAKQRLSRTVENGMTHDIIQLEFPAVLDPANAANNRLAVRVASGTVRNIRIVMPGGICANDPFVRVDDANGCPVGQFRSFADTLRANRNAIVFNPDYLRFLRNFSVVRMMNFMGSSPSYLTCAKPDPANPSNPNTFEKDAKGNVVFDQACLLQDLTWEQRSKMDDAFWGSSGNSFRITRYARGAPIEVQVELANQLNAHPWFNIPHNATEYYNREFARYVANNLKPGLKAHVEYSNETWNGIFWAYHYMQEKGKNLDNSGWGGVYFYAKRASEVFRYWEEEFGGTQRLVRLLGTYQNDANRTQRMLNYSDVRQYVDAIATGGYFYACWDRTNTQCQDTAKVPKPLVESTSVDDIFAAIDNPNDPYGLAGLKRQFENQARIAKQFGKKLYAYEGGQHLTNGTIAPDRYYNMLDLLHAANRDPRMGERYRQMLEAWQAAGGELFMLFSVPHTFSRYGSFGIKESLNQPRTSATKFDAIMKWQER